MRNFFEKNRREIWTRKKIIIEDVSNFFSVPWILRVYSACNWNYEGKRRAALTRRGRINHKARLFRAMLMTPTSSSCILCILAAKLFPPLLFFPSLKGQHTSLTQLRGIKHSCPDVQRESGPAMEATTVLGRVTSTAPRERNMYRRPVLLPSPRRNIRRRLIAGTRMISLSITYSSLLLSFRDFYGKDRNIISISFCFFFSYESEKNPSFYTSPIIEYSYSIPFRLEKTGY